MIFNLSERDTVCYEIISKFGINIKDLIDIIEQLVNKGVGVSVVKGGINAESSAYELLLLYLEVA